MVSSTISTGNIAVDDPVLGDHVPDDVRAAADRLKKPLQERPIVQAPPVQKMPEVFRAIIRNDNARGEILSKGASMSQADWCRLKELNNDKKKNLRPSAERVLRWNTDKGNVS